MFSAEELEKMASGEKYKNSKLMEFKVRSVCQKQSMRNMDMSEPLKAE